MSWSVLSGDVSKSTCHTNGTSRLDKRVLQS